jgi:alpha,alpha-trehalase
LAFNLDKTTYVQLSGEFFQTVQRSKIFPDSKTFVDSLPRFAPAEILQKWHDSKDLPDFALKQFVLDNFILPSDPVALHHITAQATNYRDALQNIWQILSRKPDPSHNPLDTLIPLPHPYVVPGGRFREVYYWDSYFTALGLIASGKAKLVENICDNFAYLIENIGFIPNGNRVYFATRSQPPVFALMVDLLATKIDVRYIPKYISAVEKEYKFWMQGISTLHGATGHIVELGPDEVLNRYFDTETLPREELFWLDEELAQDLPPADQPQFHQDMRAGAESGWDYSSRWFADHHHLKTICATQIIPIDLNSLLYIYETKLSNWYQKLQQPELSHLYSQLAAKRQQLLYKYNYHHDHGYFMDYNWHTKQQPPILSLAGVFPLFARLATPEQAHCVAEKISNDFLFPGGLVTSLENTGEQWDYPNGWAILQWITIKGLQNYGHHQLANQIKEKWCDNVIRVYNETGKFFEKYNVVELDQHAQEGEYPTQIGFGWTNGVLLDLINN